MTQILKSRDGKLYEVEDSEVALLQRDQGWVPATSKEIKNLESSQERFQRYGGAGEQAVGLAETAIRAGTLGQVSGIKGTEEEQRDRALETDDESPYLNMAAGIAPSLVAGTAAAVATGGASIPAQIAAQAGVGAVGNLGMAHDEAFKHDQELSAEQAWSAMGTGALLGGLAEVGGQAVGKLGRLGRNRLVEASSGLARREEAAAFARAGIIDPVENLAKAAEDDVVAAGIRGKAAELRPMVKKEVDEALQEMYRAQEAVSVPRNNSAEAAGDVFNQRAATRELIEQVGKEDPGLARRLMDDLDAANTSDEIFNTVRKAQSGIEGASKRAASKEAASNLQPLLKQARKLEENSSLFGKVGDDAASHNARIGELADARESLDAALSKADYTAVAGTSASKQITDALDTYTSKLEAAVQGSDNAADVLKQIQKLQNIRNTTLKDVAGANQVDLLTKPIKGSAGDDPAKALMGEVIETGVESVIPLYGLARKAWKYAKHVNRLSGGAKKTAETTAKDLLEQGLSRKIDKVVSSPYTKSLSTAVSRGFKGRNRAVSAVAADYFSDIPGDTEEQKYNHVKDLVTKLSDEPDVLAESMTAEMGDLPDEAPELYMSIMDRAGRAVQFMKSKLPQVFSFNMMYPDGPPPSRSDMIQLSLYWRGATNPEAVMQAIGKGTAMPEEVEAFKTVAPAMYDELRDNIVIQVQENARNGKTLGAYRISQLESLLEMPGGLDPTFSNDVAQIYQAGSAIETASKQASYIPPPKAGNRIDLKPGYNNT